MEKRQFMLGIGLGIIVATLLLRYLPPWLPPSPGLQVSPPQTAPVPAPITQQQGEQWMKDHGFAIVKESEWKAHQEKLKQLETNTPKATITVYINPGLSVRGIESVLVKSGLLPQQNQFAKRITEKNLARYVRSGPYTFESRVTEEAIIEEITRSK